MECKFLSVLVLYCLLSCSEKNNDKLYYFQKSNAVVFKDSLSLVEYKTVKFKLDNETGFFNRSLCNFTTPSASGTRFFSFLNLLNRSIYIYNYDTKSIIRKMRLQREGPNAVGDLAPGSAHYVDNLDSIYVFNYFQQTIYLLNNKGFLLKKYRLRGIKSNVIACPYSTSHRIVKIGNKMYIPCHLDSYYTKDSKANSTLVLNIKTSFVEQIIPFPRVYNEGSWIVPYKFINSQVFNPKTKKLIVSFPVEPFMYTCDLEGRITNKNYSSSKWIRAILPYSTENNERFQKNIPLDKIDDYVNTSHNFGALWLLESETYVRELFIRPTIDQFREKSKSVECAFLILDKSFNKIGEYKLKDKAYETSMSFVNEDGLHIAKSSDYKNDDSNLTFGVFKTVKK